MWLVGSYIGDKQSAIRVVQDHLHRRCSTYRLMAQVKDSTTLYFGLLTNRPHIDMDACGDL